MKLLLNALGKYLLGLVLIWAMLFLPAGSLRYPNGWLFLCLLFIPILILGIFLFLKAPALLQKRLESREKETTQKKIVKLSGLLFVAGFVLAGFDHRFGWTHVPGWVVIAASIVLVVSYGFYGEVMRENVYLSRIIQVQQGQKVIDTGLYGIVRHPMYTATLFLFWSIPLVLGSWWSFLCFLPFLPVLVIRIRNEEAVLARELEGYEAYIQKVRYRLIPFLW